MSKIVIYYNFVITNILLLMGFLNADTYPQLLSSLLFLPLSLFFWLKIKPNRKKPLNIPVEDAGDVAVAKNEVESEEPKDVDVLKKIKESEVLKLKKEEPADRKFDIDRRAFVKLIGSAGVTVFLFSIFTRRAQGAFFGSVPGPGIVGVKDSSGTQIDPSQEHPTNGYRLAELDDSTPAYYGFTRADGAWFIIREEATGTFKYVRGSSAFTTTWALRSDAGTAYAYYDSVF